MSAEEFQVWWSESRQRIHRWLETYSPPLAEMYKGLGLLVCERQPGWTRFAAHGVREIVNRLPGAISGETSGRLEYSDRIEAIVRLWDRAGGVPVFRRSPYAGSSEPSEASEVPLAVARLFSRLVEDHREATSRNRERALAMIRAVVPEQDHDPARLPLIAGQWTEVGRWGARVAHDQSRRDDERDVAEVLRHVRMLEEVLVGITRPFFENKELLDALLEEANS